MNDSTSPHNPKNKPSDLPRIAQFLNGYLGPELLNDIDLPANLHKDYGDMTPEEQDELFEFAFHEIFRESSIYIAGELGRSLSVLELNLIKKRILIYLRNTGMNYKNN